LTVKAGAGGLASSDGFLFYLQVKAFLADPSAFAVTAAPEASSDAPKEESKKEAAKEESEEEEDEVGQPTFRLSYTNTYLFL
jgi:hypothetical protein